MSGRSLRVAAGQLGPISKDDSRECVVDRLLLLLEKAAKSDVDLIVYPELALTTFFPRWYFEEESAIDSFFETEMPSSETQRLFDTAKSFGIGFCLGYAELTPDGHRYNTQILVETVSRSYYESSFLSMHHLCLEPVTNEPKLANNHSDLLQHLSRVCKTDSFHLE